MDDIQRPSSLVAGIARAKHLYAHWRGNGCRIEKVLNFQETSKRIQVKSVVYRSTGDPWMIFRGQVHWLQVKHVQSISMLLCVAIAAVLKKSSTFQRPA
jgi:hypothetical protein